MGIKNDDDKSDDDKNNYTDTIYNYDTYINSADESPVPCKRNLSEK